MASNTSTDITIIGASYAGLSCARTAAAHGLDVTILEAKPEVGFKPHTTGILVEEAYEHLPTIPQHLVRPIKGIRLYSPKLRHFDLFKGDYAFLAADTPGLLKWMADDVCQNERITLRTRAKFDGATQEQDRFAINNHDLDTRFIVGADGARSSVAKHFNLGENKHFLIGMEMEFEGTDFFDERFMHVFVDSELAPGYIAWAVPGVGITQVGLACKHPAHLAVEDLINKIKPIADLTNIKPLERRGGLIPAGGVVKQIGTNNVMLVGDAAGTVSPLTAGGIHKALELGALSGHAIADYLQGRTNKQPHEIIAKQAPKYYAKRHLRSIANLGVPNAMTETIFGSAMFRKFAQLIFFHHRGLLSKDAWKDIA